MRIAVFGAGGHTGRFVLAEAVRRGHTPIGIVRDTTRVAAVVGASGRDIEYRIASLASAASLDLALAGADAVVNCAGPFLDTAAAVVEAALRASAHYVDVSAEQASAIATLETFDAAARARGVAVVPAAGFFGGLGDLLATSAMRDEPRPERIDLAIALDRWWPTRGTRATGRRNTAPRLRVSGGRLETVQTPATASWTFPEPFGTANVVETPFTETILLARHAPANEIRNYMTEASLRDVRDPETPPPVAADERGRSEQRFAIEAVVRRGDVEHRITAEGRDIYAITAPIVLEAVERIAGASRGVAGAFALAEVVDATGLLDALRARDELRITTGRSQIPPLDRAPLELR